MAAELKILVRMRDMISRPLASAAGRIRRFGARLRGMFRALTSIKTGIFAFGIFRIGKSFLDAAASIEVFRKQLEMVTGSAKKADIALSAIREFARVSPLETDDVVRSYVQLRAVGINPTIKQFRVLGGVAVLMNRKLQEVLPAFIGLMKKTLRRLGIEIDRTGAKAIIQSGNIRIETTKDAASIRAALLEVWAKRFPDAITKAAGTFRAKMAIMRSNIFEFQAQLMERFLPAISKAVTSLGTFIANQTTKIGQMQKTILIFVAIFRTIWNLIQMLIDTIVAGIFQVVEAFKIVFKSLMGVGRLIFGILSRISRVWKAFAEGDFDVLKNLKAEFADFDDLAKESFKGIKTNIDNMKAAGDSWKKNMTQNNRDIISSIKAVQTEVGKVTIGGLLGGTGKLGPEAEADAKSALQTQIKLLQQRIKAVRFHSQLVIDSLSEGFEKRRLLSKQKEDDETARIKDWHAQGIINEKQFEDMKTLIALRGKNTRTKITQEEGDAKISAVANLFGGLSKLAATGAARNKGLAMAAKGLAIGEAAINTYVAANKALGGPGALPFPFNIVSMAAIIATGLANVAQIKAQKFARGTRFAPGGMGIVGERGPEAMFIPRGSQIFTAQQTRQMQASRAQITIAPVFQAPVTRENAAGIINKLDQLGNDIRLAVRGGYVDLSTLAIAK